MKLRIILLIVVPLLEKAADWLETKDENTTGSDDFAATALRIAASAVRVLQEEEQRQAALKAAA